MRNFLIISIIAIFGVFVLIILPASMSQGSGIRELEKGQVLGVNEVIKSENTENFLTSFYPLPINQEIAKEITEEPYKRNDCETIDIGNMLGVVIDAQSEKILFEKNSDVQAPIASITKLMTALTFLDYNSSLSSFIEIEKDDLVSGAKTYISVGDTIEIKDLFNLSLIASANSATKVLVRSTGLGESEFVVKMNEKAKAMGLLQTEFFDPIGFSLNNVSTAKDVAILLKNTLENEAIAEVIRKNSYSFKTRADRLIAVKSTNTLLNSYSKEGVEILGGKTGYTSSAGYCFTGGFMDEAGHELLSVVLGGPSYNSRFTTTNKIVNWAFDCYEWR